MYTRPGRPLPTLIHTRIGTLVGKSLLVAATSPFQQNIGGATALVSLDVFALQVDLDIDLLTREPHSYRIASLPLHLFEKIPPASPPLPLRD